ncbi:hypothetical protein [Celeribacter sp.]|uniref:hypothetical protein n=1 Tax=Celeribacter sp. TaxID=1890673 RepID=UPI003A8F3D2C
MNLLKKLAGTRSAVTSALDELDVIRSRNADLQSEVRRLHAAPLPVSEALEYFDQWAERTAADAIERLRPERLLDAKAAPSGLSLPSVVVDAGGGPERVYTAAIECSFGVMLDACLPAVRASVEEALEQAVAGRECLTMQERAEKLEQAKADLMTMELEEESLVRALEASGLPVERRADADPQAVLCADASLPA